MKKLKKLCLLIMLLMILTSCSKIATADYRTEDIGIITEADSVNHSLNIVSLEDRKTKTFYVENALYDNLTRCAHKYRQKIAKGDTVYIYDNGQSFLASKFSIEDAKIVNEAVTNLYWRIVFENWYWFAGLACLMAWFGWGFIFYRKTRARYRPFGAGVIILIIVWNIAGAGKTLKSAQSGTVTGISDNRVVINNSTICPAANLKDISNGQPIETGNVVTLYCYSRGNAGSGIMFISSKKLNKYVLDYTQIYPEIPLMTSLWFLCFSAIIFAITFFIRELIRKWI